MSKKAVRFVGSSCFSRPLVSLPCKLTQRAELGEELLKLADVVAK
jgi:hypothetical protein